jgi:hypothetical protein
VRQVAPFRDTAATGRRVGVWDKDKAALSVVRRGRGRRVDGVEEAVLVDGASSVGRRLALCAGFILDSRCGRPCWRRAGVRGVLGVLGSGSAWVVRGGAVMAIMASMAVVVVVAAVAVVIIAVVAVCVAGRAVDTAGGGSVGRGVVGALLMARAAVVTAVTGGVGHGARRGGGGGQTGR